MERNNAFPTWGRGHRRTGPSIAKGDTIELGAGLGPYRCEPLHQDIPQSRDGNDRCYPEFLSGGMLQKVIYRVVLDKHKRNTEDP